MSQITVIFFGPLVEITGAEEIVVTDVADTDALQQQLRGSYPTLNAAKFVLAVNRQTIAQNTALQAGSTVALLPPFSGG